MHSTEMSNYWQDPTRSVRPLVPSIRPTGNSVCSATARHIDLLTCGLQVLLALIATLDRREMKRQVRPRDQLGKRTLVCCRYDWRRGFPPIRLQRCVGRKVDGLQFEVFITGNCHINWSYHMFGLGHPRADGRRRSGGSRAGRCGRATGTGRRRIRGISWNSGRLCGWTRWRGWWSHRCRGGI